MDPEVNWVGIWLVVEGTFEKLYYNELCIVFHILFYKRHMNKLAIARHVGCSDATVRRHLKKCSPEGCVARWGEKTPPGSAG